MFPCPITSPLLPYVLFHLIHALNPTKYDTCKHTTAIDNLLLRSIKTIKYTITFVAPSFIPWVGGIGTQFLPFILKEGVAATAVTLADLATAIAEDEYVDYPDIQLPIIDAAKCT